MKDQIYKYSIVSMFGEGTKYIGGVIFVDIIGFKFFIVGLIIGIFTYIISFILNKKWVFK